MAGPGGTGMEGRSSGGDRVAKRRIETGVGAIKAEGEGVDYDAWSWPPGSAPSCLPCRESTRKGRFSLPHDRGHRRHSGLLERGPLGGWSSGGLLGLEAAAQGSTRGLETHVAKSRRASCPGQLAWARPPALGGRAIRGMGVHVQHGTHIRRCSVTWPCGHRILEAIGRRPIWSSSRRGFAHGTSWLARTSEVGERGGVVVDDSRAPATTNVFAIGEAALHRGHDTGMVAPG